MEKFRYSFFARLLYRYGNIIATALLSLHLLTSIIAVFQNWYFVFPALINVWIIYIINRYFFKTYRLFPFCVEVDNEKMICHDFFLSKKIIEIRLENIDNVSGGFFNGYPTRPIYIHDGKNEVTVGFYSHVGNFQNMLKKILQNIPQHLYDDLMNSLNNMKG